MNVFFAVGLAIGLGGCRSHEKVSEREIERREKERAAAEVAKTSLYLQELREAVRVQEERVEIRREELAALIRRKPSFSASDSFYRQSEEGAIGSKNQQNHEHLLKHKIQLVTELDRVNEQLEQAEQVIHSAAETSSQRALEMEQYLEAREAYIAEAAKLGEARLKLIGETITSQLSSEETLHPKPGPRD